MKEPTDEQIKEFILLHGWILDDRHMELMIKTLRNFSAKTARIKDEEYQEEILKLMADNEEAACKLKEHCDAECQQKMLALIEAIEGYKTPRRHSSRPYEEFRIPSLDWQALKSRLLES